MISFIPKEVSHEIKNEHKICTKKGEDDDQASEYQV